MNGLGGLNKSPHGVGLGMVQLQLPVVVTPDDLARQTQRIVEMVAKARRNMPGTDLVVFPEYALHGLSMDTNPEIMCRLDGPEVLAFQQACKDNHIWGCFSIMEYNPHGYPYNVGLIIDDVGDIKLYYRKLHPWVPVEPWEPGDLGIPVIEGPNGCRLSLIICHDGMFPELAREAAYKGANVYIRISGYSTQVNDQWIWTNQSNAWQNLMYTISVNLAGYDGVFYYFGEGTICNYDGNVIQQGHRNPWEIVTAELFPRLVDKARENWALENNIFNLGCRAYVGKPGGEKENYLTWVKDLAEGKYKLPWDEKIKIRDGWKYYPDGVQLGPMPKDE